MPRPEDRIRLIFPDATRPGEFRYRHWWIQQPSPTVALALQGRIAAAVGEAAGFALGAFFASDEQEADFAADKATLGEALALQTLRRARAGKALFQPEDRDSVTCSDRLWAVLRVAQAKSGGTLDANALMGDPERVRGAGMGHRWATPSLLHRLLLASCLRYDGEVGEFEGPMPPLPDGPPQPPTPPAQTGRGGDGGVFAAAMKRYADDCGRAALRDAVTEGSISAFTAALDQVLCSPDELALLSAWAILHLWRPF